MAIRRTFKIELDREEELSILRKYANRNPKVLEILLKHPKGSCPFSDECNQFPCETLHCNADTCENGHCYRWS
ncbi:MAG: hypothetical protein K9H48_07750 [Melioribacteraceae bacterium]|nr:hypothetical protein [Melioribacteraceae bacterium]